MDKLRIIKGIVFFLSGLIVLFFGIIIYTVTTDKAFLKKDSDKLVELKEKAGTEVKDFKINNKTLYLLLTEGGEGDRMLIMDTSSGKVLGRVYVSEKEKQL